MASASFTVDGSVGRLVAEGDWVVDAAATIDATLRSFAESASGLRHIEISVGHANRIDTTGAYLLLRAKRAFEAAGIPTEVTGLDADRKVLFDAVAARKVERPAPPPPTNAALDSLAETGQRTRESIKDAAELLAFFGAVSRAFGRVIRQPRRFRMTSVVSHLERAGLQAMPIVILISFLIGAIIAQQGAFQLRRFGAEVFVVNLVGILVLREVGLLLAAIMFAGRTGSAATAEIGSMRMREEIDAMRVIGLDPIEVLVIPRLVAMIIALPIVTIVANFAALFGGLITCWIYLGIEPQLYMDQLRSAISVRHFSVGLIKAPFMALIIGVIACSEGMRVRGSTESLGQHTTASVVKAIFMVIVVDGIFAMVFAALNV